MPNKKPSTPCRPPASTPAARRALLSAGALALFSHALSPARAAEPVRATPPAPTPPTPRSQNVGRKFRADGTVHPFAGNTFIGHLPQQGPYFAAFDTVLDLYRALPAQAFAAKLSALPPSSYHVTLFIGVNDADRAGDAWTGPYDRAAPMSAINAAMRRKLAALPPPDADPFDFVIGNDVPLKRDGTLQVPLLPADAATAARLQSRRDALSALTGLRRADHAHYQYHLTIGYLHAVLDDREARAMRAFTTAHLAQWRGAGLRLRIPAFHYCEFRDMFCFAETIAV